MRRNDKYISEGKINIFGRNEYANVRMQDEQAVGWCGMKIDGKVIPECDGKYESTIQE